MCALPLVFRRTIGSTDQINSAKTMTMQAPTSDLATSVAPSPRRRFRRMTIGLTLLLVLLVLVLTVPAFCVGGPFYYGSKYSRVGAPRPARVAQPLKPEVQTEPHTCGFHALSSIYRAYGLDPAVLKLRFRLGTDKPLTNFMADSTGTIPADIARVIKQDGFTFTELDPADIQSRALLSAHLRAGQTALALTHKDSLTTGLHWIAIENPPHDSSSTFLICDSLAPEKVEEDSSSLLGRLRVLWLISPVAR